MLFFGFAKKTLSMMVSMTMNLSATDGLTDAFARVSMAATPRTLSCPNRLANAVRLTINPSSVADVEGVRDVATALKATKKLVSKASKAQQENDDKAKGKAEEGGKAKEDEEPEPLYPNAPR